MSGRQIERSLYVHVPFCARKCSYCAFYSEASDGELMNRYVAALLKEFELLPHGFRPNTVFFGGGTPSILNLRQWEMILKRMEQLGLIGSREWTIECNPATVSSDKARLWREFGVNRISMGVQSLDEALLDRLGRIHSREQVFKSYDLLRRSGFENINIDLMFAIPGQSLEIWADTLDEAMAMDTEHLSCYEVIYEEDTALYAQLHAGEFSLDEDLACSMYELLQTKAAEAGFQQYEIANFAKSTIGGASVLASRELPGRACLHNVNYWRGGEYAGLGPSAAGYFNGVRTKNWSNTQLYCERLERGQSPAESEERLAPLKRAGETAAFGLRMNSGWPWDAFTSATGFDLRSGWKAEISELIDQGHGQADETGFRLTSAGLRFADAAAELFLR